VHNMAPGPFPYGSANVVVWAAFDSESAYVNEQPQGTHPDASQSRAIAVETLQSAGRDQRRVRSV
jgi:hypothetical protein